MAVPVPLLPARALQVQRLKSSAMISEGWTALYETALFGIEHEGEKHDLQRDYILQKLQSIIDEVRAQGGAEGGDKVASALCSG